MSTYHNATRWHRSSTREIRHTYYAVFKSGTENENEYTTVIAVNRLDAKAQLFAKYGHNICEPMTEREWQGYMFRSGKTAFEQAQ